MDAVPTIAEDAAGPAEHPQAGCGRDRAQPAAGAAPDVASGSTRNPAPAPLTPPAEQPTGAVASAAGPGHIDTLSAPAVTPPGLAKLSEKTGQPVRPWTIWASAVLMFGGAKLSPEPFGVTSLTGAGQRLIDGQIRLGGNPASAPAPAETAPAAAAPATTEPATTEPAAAEPAGTAAPAAPSQ